MNMSLSCAHTLHRTGVTCTLPGTRSCCAYDSTTPFEAPLPLLLPSALCTVDCAVLNGVRGYAVGETRVYVSSLPYSWHLMPCLVRVHAHLIPPRVARCLLQSMYSRGSCSSSVTFPYRGKLLHRETSAAFPSAAGPLVAPGSGVRSNVAHLSAARIKVREGKGALRWTPVYSFQLLLVYSIPCSS